MKRRIFKVRLQVDISKKHFNYLVPTFFVVLPWKSINWKC